MDSCLSALRCRYLGTLAIVAALASVAIAKEPQWAGEGKYRILVRVKAESPASREEDETPTRFGINSDVLQAVSGSKRKIDVASIQVGEYDLASGEAIPYGKWAYAKIDWERPHRWYDASIPDAFPEVMGSIDTATGKLHYANQQGWGHFYETLGEWDAGNLAWIHTQRGDKPSYYAIYFDLLPEGAQPDAVPRAGFVGDGGERLEEQAGSTHGFLLSRAEPVDWNGDGLIDILSGCERGGMVWYPNRGTKEQPSYPYPKLLFTTDGKPLDVGFNSTPIVIDWNGDGLRDVISGAYPDRAVWYRNVGSNEAPALEYVGLIYVGDSALSLPRTPVPEGEGIYPTDYFPTLEAADWDADGDTDLLAGGYVTGRIYLFENIGKRTDGAPLLADRGAIEADGEPIDTQWCAAPGVADFDGDGDLDLVSGSMAMTETGGDSSSKDFLYYFENVGSRKEPRLTRKPFPIQGADSSSSLAGPRPVDLNNDGLTDLLVARTTDLSIYYNVGTKQKPMWQHSPPLPGKWRTASIYGWGAQLIDWNGDDRFDIVQNFTARLNSGEGNPQFFNETVSLIGPGENLFHKSPSGDQWTFTHVVDLDSDGNRDILYGVHEGWVYFHRNLTNGGDVKFDTEGVRLKLEDGSPIRVGPSPDQKQDFDTLQGARTTMAAADFDRDGKVDVVVGDTYGVIRYFRNLSGGAEPTFAAPQELAKLNMRLVPSIADWNDDGWPDVLAGSSQSFVILNRGQDGETRFLPAELIQPPANLYQSSSVLEQIPGSPEWHTIEPDNGAGIYLPFETVLNSADWNHDGDSDLIALASYGYLCWYERSFLRNGYAPAEFAKIESRHSTAE